MALGKIGTNQIDTAATPTVASATVTGDLTVDTSTLKVDSTNNRVGIGNASPSSTLHIGTGYSTLQMGANDSTGFHWAKDTSALNLYTGASGAGTLRFGIDTSGRVTMPYQPCASASYAGGDIAPTNVIPLNNNPITRGGITISSNRFTVPVGGTYVVGYHHLATNTGTQIAIRKNGADINSGAGAYTQINPATAHGNGSAQNLVELSTSDYIEFVVGLGVIHGNSNYNRMYIYLLG